ncbi:MAG: hypothetical protein OXG98_07535 [Gemmatimonadetes bacterium]|nr:hypothetical protein [Gemmatimonadota bacterium]
MDATIKAALIGVAVLMYLDLKAEIRDLRDKLDRVETKVDEVRGYLKFNASDPDMEFPPASPEKEPAVRSLP